MIILRRLGLRNFCRFRGEHVVTLPEGPSEVVVCSEKNAAGKTTLLEAVGFALWGHHAVRYPRASDVVSAGESEAEVTLELSDGSVITRTAGARPQLTFSGPGGTYEGVQSAQPAIADYLGIERDGYLGAVHVPQGRVDALADATPSRRREVLLSWLDSSAWEQMVEGAAAEYSRRSSDLESLRGALAECRRSIIEHDDVDSIEARLAAASASMEAAAGAARAAERNARREELAARARQTRAQIVGTHVEDITPVSGASEELSQVAAALAAQLPVARGAFDGKCPLAGMPCPSRSFVDDARSTAASEVARLRTRQDEISTTIAEERRAEERRRRAEHERAVLVGQYNQAIAHLRQWPVEEVITDGDPTALAVEVTSLRDELAAARASLRAEERASQLAAEVSAAEVEVQAWGLAVRALRATPGPLAAARSAIEESCGHLLEPFGIRVAIGGVAQVGLAGACPCGHRYRGQQLTCPRCQVPRGAGRDDSIPVMVDDGSAAGPQDIRVKSGAGRDLASLALYLASVATNHRCHVGWRLYDEASSSLCGNNRHAFVQMLRRARNCRAVQHVVVSHDREIVDAFDHRIEVVVDGQYSRIMQG